MGGYRHFCNKLWNATRFAMKNGLAGNFVPKSSLAYLRQNAGKLRRMDAWILSRLADTVTTCNITLGSFDMTAATTSLFNFWLYDLCDYYIEYLKPSFHTTDEKEEEEKIALS